MTPENMIELALSGEGTDFGQELYAAFCNGFPLDHLRPLLRHPDPAIAALGSYLVYELGPRARALLDDIVPLLAHADPQIRSDAIVTIGVAATQFEPNALASALERLQDEDRFVRRTAMRFVRSCEQRMLVTAVLEAGRSNPGTVFAEFPASLGRTLFKKLYREKPVSRETIANLIAHPSPVARRFGVALATRPRAIEDQSFVDLVEGVDQAECRDLVAWSRDGPCASHVVSMRL